MSDTLFGPPPEEKAARTSPEERAERTLARLFARGLHPATKKKVLSHGMCGQCLHHRAHGRVSTCEAPCITKPGGMVTRSAWPACELFDREAVR